jgi:predicted dehydrogenase
MLRVALVGAGMMGANHARVISGDRRAELTHVVDVDESRAQALASAHGAQAACALEAVLGNVDAAVVAVPTAAHAEVAVELLRAGVPVLVEKPIAASSAEARSLVEAARSSGTLLATGHVERFNPAVLELETVAADIVHMDFRRISSFSPRVRDGVVRDLMIHDLDLALWLAGAEVTSVSAIGRSTRTEMDDLAVALLGFANGITAMLTASRIGQQKIREIDLTQKENYVHVDLVRGDLTIHHVHHVEFLAEGIPRYSQAGVVEIPYLSNRGEPLGLQWADFARAATMGEEPRVDGEAGQRALELVERVEAALAQTV